MENYDPKQSLNQQIADFNITNTEPMGAANDDGNANPLTLVRKSNHDAKNKLKPDIGINNLEQLYKIIVSNAGRIDFNTYIDAMGGNHEKYIKDGKSKIPLSVTAVIANDYLIILVSLLGYSLSQLYNNDAEVKVTYLFNGKYWLPITEGFIRNLLRNVLVKMGYDPLESQTVGLSDLLVRTSWNKVPKSPNKNNRQILINLDNGTLEIMPNGEVKQLRFNPDNFMLYCLPYEYNHNSKTPLFTKYLDRVLPDKESQKVLQELLGIIFIKNINLEKIGILYGSGANGKSVLLKIITALLGENNISQMDLKSLTTDSNAANNRAQLMGKLLNFAPEINGKGEQAHDLIKRMASCEAIQVKMLYKDTITITDYAKLIFNADVLPSDVGHSHGFFRRFLIVEFGKTITDEEKDPELANKIMANELPGVLNWIIEGTKRLQQNKQFSSCKKSDELLDRYRLESDVVAMWIAERSYIPHEYLSKLLKDLSLDLKDFASNGGYKYPSAKTIADRLRNLGFKTEKPKGYPTKVYITVNNNIIPNF